MNCIERVLSADSAQLLSIDMQQQCRFLDQTALRLAQRRLASRLRARGLGKGSCLYILDERSTDTVIAVLAAMSIGATALLLDKGCTHQQLLHTLRWLSPTAFCAGQSAYTLH